MRRIDLHAHTIHSDGTETPADLVRLAHTAGLAALAVTDHDVTSALAEAQSAGAAIGIEVLAGVEVSTQREGGTIHVLGYGFEPEDAAFQRFLLRVREAREERNVRLLERLASLGMPLGMDEVLLHARGRIVARPHFALAMVARKYVPSLRVAFQLWLGDRCPGYVEPRTPAPEEAIRALAAAGGVSVLAHPKQIALGERKEWRALLSGLREAGLAGVEVDHPTHKPEDRALFAALAKELGLVASGGSDYHGANKPHIAIGVGDGTIEVGYETWERLRERCRRAG